MRSFDWYVKRSYSNRRGGGWAEGIHEGLNERLEAERVDTCHKITRKFGDDIHERVSGLLARIGNFERLRDVEDWCDHSETGEELLTWLTFTVAHDELYEQLLTNPHTVAGTLRVLAAQGMLPADCLERLDLENMIPIPTERTGSEFQKQHLSVVWRVPVRGGGEPPVYLLLEHQPHSDPETQPQFSEYVNRISTIVGMRGLDPSDPMPPVLSVVLHNGAKEWDIPTGAVPGSVAGQLEAVAGTVRYLVLDVVSCDLSKLPPDDPISWWIRVERADTTSEFQAALEGAKQAMRGEEFAGLRKAFFQLLKNPAWEGIVTAA